jgi:transposase
MVLDANVHLSSAWSQGGVKEQERQPAAGPGDAVCLVYPPPIASKRVARREAILLLAEAGIAIRAIVAFVQYSVATVRRCIRRGGETDDLNDRRRCGRPRVYSEEIHLRLVAFYCQIRPLPGSGRWTLRWAARHLSEHPERVGAAPSKFTLHRVLRRNKLKPHQSRYFLHKSNTELTGQATSHLLGG